MISEIIAVPARCWRRWRWPFQRGRRRREHRTRPQAHRQGPQARPRGSAPEHIHAPVPAEYAKQAPLSRHLDRQGGHRQGGRDPRREVRRLPRERGRGGRAGRRGADPEAGVVPRQGDGGRDVARVLVLARQRGWQPWSRTSRRGPRCRRTRTISRRTTGGPSSRSSTPSAATTARTTAPNIPRCRAPRDRILSYATPGSARRG